jgi:hypothetical protein
MHIYDYVILLRKNTDMNDLVFYWFSKDFLNGYLFLSHVLNYSNIMQVSANNRG